MKKSFEDKALIKVISVIEKEILISVAFTDLDQMFKILKSIEQEEDFLGFISITFDVNELPKIKYMVSIKEDESN